MKPYSDITNPRVIKALAHPLRVRILSILEERDMASPNELADELSVSLGVMSYHVRRLHALGFLELVKRTPRRGAIEHHYRAKARPQVSNEGWAETPAIVKRAMVGAALQQLSGYVNTAASKGGFDRGDAHLSRSSITLDEQGWTELAAEMTSNWIGTIERLEAESTVRLRDQDSKQASPVGVVMMLFEAEGVRPDDEEREAASEPHLGRRSSRRPQPLHAAHGADLD
jgi:DNA-binding transcriptional ArsR family regulator